jgi:hypothetical protein
LAVRPLFALENALSARSSGAFRRASLILGALLVGISLHTSGETWIVRIYDPFFALPIDAFFSLGAIRICRTPPLTGNARKGAFFK